MAMLYDKGLFDYEDKVCKIWPKFGKHGKDDIRICDVLRIVRFIEPFSLPNFKNAAPQLSDYRHPFFKTDVVSRSRLER